MYPYAHVLWSPQTGPICAYADPTLAWAHARTMLGVEVASVEIRTALPEIAREDMETEYDGDESTPVTVPVPLEDIADE